MKKKVLILSCTALFAVGTMAYVSIGNTHFTAHSYLIKGDNETHDFTLSSSKQPVIDGSGNGTLIYNDSCTVNYTKASLENGYHVVLANGGTIDKGESRGLQTITVTFTGKLRVRSSYASDDTNYVYELTSGVSKSLHGNYFVIESLQDDTKITSINVTYSCNESESAAKTYSGKDFFNGNSWYTMISSNKTEDGTPIGSSLINSNGEVEFYHTSEGESNFGHIDIFQGSDNLYLYNTIATGGIYKSFKDYQDEFKTFDNSIFHYDFDFKTTSAVSFMIGGAVKAKNVPGCVEKDGNYLATYLNIGSHGTMSITQGSTGTGSGSIAKIVGSHTGQQFYTDGTTSNHLKIELSRHIGDFNDASTDYLVLRATLNDVAAVFYGTPNSYNYSSLEGNYVLQSRLSDNTQYGPYFSAYLPQPESGSNTIKISDFSWGREVDAATGLSHEKVVYALINGDTYTDSISTVAKKNYESSKTLKAYRDTRSGISPQLYKDAYFRFDMKNVLKNAKYASNIENNSNAMVHIRLSVSNGSSIAEFSNQGWDVRAYDYTKQTYTEDGSDNDWLKKITWANAKIDPSKSTDESYWYIGRNQETVISGYTVNYAEDFYEVEIIVPFLNLKNFINPDSYYMTLCIDSNNNENGFYPEFCAQNYSASSSDPKEIHIPRIFVTY